MQGRGSAKITPHTDTVTITTISLIWHFSFNGHGQPIPQGMDGLGEGPKPRRVEGYSEVEELILKKKKKYQ